MIDSSQGPLDMGSRFQRYEVRRLVGVGAHSYVYEAHQDFVNRDVAIKVIPRYRRRSLEAFERAQREAALLSRLKHPNVVEVYDANISDDGAFIYIVMELLRGRTLLEVIGFDGPLSIVEALQVGIQTCEGVQAAHTLNVIHRDLKPSNIVIETGNAVKVVDFGVAKFLGNDHQATDRFHWRGTPDYMSPEQFQALDVDARSDVYSLGMVVYEMLRGRHPWRNGIAEPSVREIGWAQLFQRPPRLTEIFCGFPRYVADVVERAIEKDPKLRYQTMDAFAEALRHAENTFRNDPQQRSHGSESRDLAMSTVASTGPASAFWAVREAGTLERAADVPSARSLGTWAANLSTPQLIKRAMIYGAIASVPAGVGLALLSSRAREVIPSIVPTLETTLSLRGDAQRRIPTADNERTTTPTNIREQGHPAAAPGATIEPVQREPRAKALRASPEPVSVESAHPRAFRPPVKAKQRALASRALPTDPWLGPSVVRAPARPAATSSNALGSYGKLPARSLDRPEGPAPIYDGSQGATDRALSTRDVPVATYISTAPKAWLK